MSLGTGCEIKTIIPNPVHPFCFVREVEDALS